MRNDDCQCSDLFAFNCQIGFLFETDEEEGGGRFYRAPMDCSTDAWSPGYVVSGNHNLNPTTSSLINHLTSLDVDGEAASIRITACHLQSNGAPAIILRQSKRLLMSDSVLSRAFEADHFYVDAAACGSLTVSGCQFSPWSPEISLGEGVQRPVITGNILESDRESIRHGRARDGN